MDPMMMLRMLIDSMLESMIERPSMDQWKHSLCNDVRYGLLNAQLGDTQLPKWHPHPQ
jgi:hypothetical protein